MFIYGNSEWTSSPYASANTNKYYPSSVFDEEVKMHIATPYNLSDSMRCIDWESQWTGFSIYSTHTAMFPGNSQDAHLWTNPSNVTTDNRLIRCNAFKTTECKCCNGLSNVMTSAKANGTTNAKKFRTNPSTKLPTLTHVSNISAVMPTKLNTANKYALLSEIVPIGTYSKWGDYGLTLDASFSNSSSGVYIRFGNYYGNTFQYEFYIKNITFGFDISFSYVESQDETLYTEDFEWLVENAFNGTTGSSYTYSYGGPASGSGILSFNATESEIIKYANDVTDEHLDPLLRNYVNSTTNTIFTNNASVRLPYCFDYFTEFELGALLFGVCLYKLRMRSATRYARNGNYNNLYAHAQGGDAQPEFTGLEGECITLMFKSVGAAGVVKFHFLLRSVSFEISPFKNFYLELTPLRISGSSQPYTIEDWTIVPARNIRTFTLPTEITFGLRSAGPGWAGDVAGSRWIKPNIYIVYNGGSICDLTPISGQNVTSQTITINGAGYSSIPAMLYKSPQITTS